ncbi:RNA-directed DNA polymerase, eukaryota [Tanacetum coccineum]
MESLHLSFSRAVEAGIFKGYKIDPSTTLSHLFYADDAVFIGEWSHSNLKGIMNILRCFSLLSGMSINIQKSHLLGVGIPDNCVAEAAKSIGCLIMKAPFKYLGILVGDNMSSKKTWDETINKMKKRLSRWKLNTLSVGGLHHNEVNSLKVKGVDLISHCKIRVGKSTENKDISVADKMNTSISSSFVVIWFWDLNGDGVFQVKDVRSMLERAFLPKMEVPTRWIKSIPIKVNVFAWKLYLDRLPTRSNLSRRNVSLPSLACPLCDHVLEDSSHLFFGCSVAKDIQKLICRWWNLDVHPYESYEDWLSWFKSIRLGSKTKEVLEGVFYVSWWSLWNFRNQFLFASPIPRKDAIFDNIVLRSFYWCVARCNRTLNWVSWLQHPFLIPL